MTADYVITDLDELADLRLPWHVRDSADGLVAVERLAEHDEFREVTVGEVVADPDHPVLLHRHPDARYSDWTHDAQIGQRAAEIEAHPELREVHAAAWRLDDGKLVLADGSHRACALARLEMPAGMWRVVLSVSAEHALYRPPARKGETALSCRCC